jgi:glutamyl-tRNA synthetase
MIELFSLERVNRAPASFDPKKLWAFQDRYMLQVPIEAKVKMALPYLQKAGLVEAPAPGEIEQKVTEIVRAAGERIETAGDILDYSDFFLPDDQLAYDEKAFDKRIRKAPGAVALLGQFKDRLATAEIPDAKAAEKLVQGFVEAGKIALGDIIHALRVAVTGKAIGFGLFETLAILGKELSLARIERALGRV